MGANIGRICYRNATLLRICYRNATLLHKKMNLKILSVQMAVALSRPQCVNDEVMDKWSI